jgi:hypothetical protein
MSKTKPMTETLDDAAKNGAAHAHDTIAHVNNSMMKALEQNRAILQHLVHAMQEESLRFVNNRFEHTSHAIERSRECQGLSGLITLQQDWLMDVARDYAEMNKRLGEVLREMTEHGAHQLHELGAEAARAQTSGNGGERVAAE